MSERPKRITEIIAMLTYIDEDDSGGESQTKESDVSDEMRWAMMKKLSNLMMHNPLFMWVIYKLLILTLKPILLHVLMMILVWCCWKFEHTRDSKRWHKWEFMEFCVEARGRRAAQNVLTDQSGLSRFALRMADSSVGAFQVILVNHMLKHIQQCTNVEAWRVLGNEEWEVSLCELNAFIPLLYVQGASNGKNFSLHNFWSKKWGVSFFQQTMTRNKPKKNVCVLSSLHRLCLLRLAYLRKRNRKQWNFITRPNMVLMWLIKWPGSIQSKLVPVSDPLLFSTTFWIWQASMHLCSIKKQHVTRFQYEISCSSLLQNYVREEHIVEKSSRNTTIARPHQLSTAPKNTKSREV